MLQMMSYPVQKSYITSNTRHFIKVRKRKVPLDLV
jgi:hypothetical protein